MKRTIWIAIAALLLAAPPAWAVNDDEWRNAEDGAGQECTVTMSGTRCFWSFDAAGQSPLLTHTCPKVLLWVKGTSPDVDPYVCRDATFANCERLQATNLRTGTYGDVTLDGTDWGVLNIPFRSLMMDRQGGSGNVIAECSY